MRLGVSCLGTSPAAWRQLARDAESIGFDVLHLADHLVDGLPPPFTSLAEAVEILHRLLAGESVNFQGEHYTLDEHRCWPVPTQPVPILVCGNGDRVLRVADQHADIVGFTGFAPGRDGTETTLTHMTAAGLEDRLDHVRASAGDRADALDLQVLVQVVIVTPDRRQAAEPVAERMGVGVDDVLDSPFLLLGTHEQMAEQLREHTERFGIETWTVFAERPGLTDQRLDTLAPVIERLRRA